VLQQALPDVVRRHYHAFCKPLEITMRRRELLGALGATAAALPLSARAQQTEAPAIGLLSSAPFATRQEQVAGFRRGLREAGFVEGQNVKIEY
jgi:putative tryptophan/tyrosine transport system substrate-binding protein